MPKVRKILEEIMEEREFTNFSEELISQGITNAEFFEYMRNPPATPADLRLQKHYDKVARRLQTKAIEFKMRYFNR